MIPICTLYYFKNTSDIVLKIDDSEYLKNVYDLEQFNVFKKFHGKSGI